VCVFVCVCVWRLVLCVVCLCGALCCVCVWRLSVLCPEGVCEWRLLLCVCGASCVVCAVWFLRAKYGRCHILFPKATVVVGLRPTDIIKQPGRRRSNLLLRLILVPTTVPAPAGTRRTLRRWMGSGGAKEERGMIAAPATKR
jgi:hypothetical protein